MTRHRGDLLINVHIDGGESAVGDGAADGTGKGESGVELEARELGGGSDLSGGVGLAGHCI